MSDSDDTRGRTVFVAEWWPVRAKEQREALGLTQEALSGELGISTPTMSRDLHRNVNVVNVERIARRLGLPPPVVVPASEAEARAIDHLLSDMRRAVREGMASLNKIEGEAARERDSGAQSGSNAARPRRPARSRPREQ